MRISNNGYGYQRIQNQTDVASRADRIANIKKQIAEGTYQPDKTDVARKILQSPNARQQLGFDERV